MGMKYPHMRIRQHPLQEVVICDHAAVEITFLIRDYHFSDKYFNNFFFFLPVSSEMYLDLHLIFPIGSPLRIHVFCKVFKSFGEVIRDVDSDLLSHTCRVIGDPSWCLGQVISGCIIRLFWFININRLNVSGSLLLFSISIPYVGTTIC